jgi:hypothetical protein
MRGVTTTTRGKTVEWPKQQSRVWKRNASADDLAAGQRHIGETVQLTRNHGPQPPLYAIAGVRLDCLSRLIADLVLVQ